MTDPVVDRPHASPTTTAEQDRASLGVRRMNLIWETTQAAIAILVTGTALVGNIAGHNSDVLNNACFVVLGFYFGRTNHARPSGVH